MVKGDLSNALQGPRSPASPGCWTRPCWSRTPKSTSRPSRASWQDRTHELAQQIVVGLYPAQLTTQATVDRTDEFLASLPEDSAALRRMMLENRDGVARALRARAGRRRLTT